ncbi:unnamed protein product [Ixodes persulcatus]
MAPSISKEELMRNSDPLVWELGGTDDAEKTERLCERLWIALNSRFCNIIIVTITVIESLVILSELLIDLEYIQDPAWHPKNYNCSVNQTLPAYPSARLKAAKTILSYLSLAILTIFLTEVIFRIVTGKSRFLVQGLEILDAVIIITAFSLDVAFYASPTKDKAKEAAVLIVLLRVWRIKRVIDSIVDVEKLKLSYIISEYQREKTISENKGEVLILRVEDLEHEVAYLKEKHKKMEKELQALRKRGKRDSGSSSSSSCRHATVTIGIETCLPSSSSVETQTSDLAGQLPLVPPVLQTFASNLTQGVLSDALSLVGTEAGDGSLGLRDPPASKFAAPIPTRHQHAPNYNTAVTAATVVRHALPSYLSGIVSDQVLKGGLVESTDSPESGYGSAGSTALTGSGGGRHARSATVFLFPEPEPRSQTGGAGRSGTEHHWQPHHLVEMDVLDEALEIERVRRVEFDPDKCAKDIPMTSL